MKRPPDTVEHCAIVVLAAGAGSRLGNPKQLLVYHGKSLLQHATLAALQTNLQPVVVVTGANSGVIKKQIKGIKVSMAENKDWQEGMASSLRCGLAAVLKIKPETDGIIFMVCDQPHVTESVLRCLLKAQQETGLPVVASSYENKLGTPALFHKSFFAGLMKLKGDTGARCRYG